MFSACASPLALCLSRGSLEPSRIQTVTNQVALFYRIVRRRAEGDVLQRGSERARVSVLHVEQQDRARRSGTMMI
jgi:hypothetical protein